MNNEAANGTAIDHVLSAIDPGYKKTNWSKHWIRFPHILNLVAQAFLLGENPEIFEATAHGAELKNDPEELRQIWRERGFIGKLTNIIRSVWRSPKQRDMFESIKVDESGDIEWLVAKRSAYGHLLILSANLCSSSSLPITRLVGTQLWWCYNVLQAYCSNWLPERGSSSRDDGDNYYDLREDILSPEEWKGVNEVIKVLKLLLYFTKLVERRDTGLQDSIPIVDKLITHFYEASQRLKSMADKGPTYKLRVASHWLWESLGKAQRLLLTRKRIAYLLHGDGDGSKPQSSMAMVSIYNTAGKETWIKWRRDEWRSFSAWGHFETLNAKGQIFVLLEGSWMQ
jgi:hypothetical protein